MNSSYSFAEWYDQKYPGHRKKLLQAQERYFESLDKSDSSEMFKAECEVYIEALELLGLNPKRLFHNTWTPDTNGERIIPWDRRVRQQVIIYLYEHCKILKDQYLPTFEELEGFIAKFFDDYYIAWENHHQNENSLNSFVYDKEHSLNLNNKVKFVLDYDHEGLMVIEVYDYWVKEQKFTLNHKILVTNNSVTRKT